MKICAWKGASVNEHREIYYEIQAVDWQNKHD